MDPVVTHSQHLLNREKKPVSRRFHMMLAIIFVATWIWAAIDPADSSIWFVENLLVFTAVPLILVIGYYVQFSRTSWFLLTLFFVLHLIGTHYTYAEVPFGYMLQEWLGSSRNVYDRLVHFSFGLLLFYPIREVVLSISARRMGIWGLYVPLDVIVALSAIYELLEWAAVHNQDERIVNGILGSQGDIWDAQKDILAAICGGLTMAAVVAFVHWKYNPHFWRDFRQSIASIAKRRGNDDDHLFQRIVHEWRHRPRLTKPKNTVPHE